MTQAHSINDANRGKATRRYAARRVTGLAIGSYAANLVVLRWRGATGTVERAASTALAKGVSASADELVGVLRPWLREHAGRGGDLLVSLPSELVDYETIELAEDAPVDLVALAQQAIERLLGDEAPLASYDFWTTANGPDVGPCALHLAWTSSGFASHLADELARDGWRVRAFEAPSIALARVVREPYRPAGRLMVDVGAGEVSLVWSRGDAVEYVRNRIRFASGSAAEVVAQSLSIRREVAEVLIAPRIVDDRLCGPLETLVHEPLGEWCGRLSFEIHRTLSYLASRFEVGGGCDIVLCGDGACVAGLAHELTQRLDRPVREVPLPRAMCWEAGEHFSPRYVLATSLALGEVSA